ncbi:MAG: ECF-type sigma factor, partial [Bacteroidota bacterium]
MRAEPTTTQLLHDARAGDDDALDRLFPRLYDELRQLAHARLRRHRQSDTLSTTALVHEAYLKLTAGQAPTVADRTHFFALAARAMRFVLVSYARDRTAQKRGGGEAALAFDEALGDGLVRADAEAADLLTLDHALERLA